MTHATLPSRSVGHPRNLECIQSRSGLTTWTGPNASSIWCRHLTNPLSEDRVFGTREGSDRWALTAELFVT